MRFWATRLLVLACAWFAVARLLATHGAELLPRSVARALTLQSFLAIVQIVSTAAGVGLAFAVAGRRTRASLGLGRLPAPSSWLRVALGSPAVLVFASYAAILVALPTLKAELLQGGKQAVESNAGAFGRALSQTPLALTLLWSAVLAPIAEELIFRGVLWSGITALTRRLLPRGPRSLPPELLAEAAPIRAARSLGRLMARGGLATLISAAVFAWAHADLEGGVGIVRVVSTFVLGVACGVMRHATDSVLTSMWLHALFNGLAVLQLRGYAVTSGWPKYYTVPTLYSLIAGIALLALGGWAFAARLARARLRAR